MTYTVNYTNKNKDPIVIEDEDIDESLGISLFGRNRLSYGEEAQENFLHILESFSAPESTITPNTPDTTKIYNGILSGPVEGHLWYNSTDKSLNWYNGTVWQPLTNRDDLASNWGTITDGGTIPKPISPLTGKVFDYSECVWIVSPYNLPQLVDGFNCTTDDNAVVNMKYKAGSQQISGIANYMIVGLSGNRPTRQQTISYTINNAADGSFLSSTSKLAAQCIPALTNELGGMNCTGATVGCATGNCAPMTGINFTLTLSGGTGPYTAILTSITRNETSTECVNFGYDSVSARIHTNSKTTAANATLGTITTTPNTFGPISILSDCGSVATPITGVITVAVSDAQGHTRNVYINYSSERLYPTNPVNEVSYTTPAGCGDVSISTANMIAIGSPNYIFVQNSFALAPGNSRFYMTRTFSIPASGVYTMKLFHDDSGWVYVDGNLVYGSSDNHLSCVSYATIPLTLTSGSHQLLLGYENIPDQTPGYMAFSIYDPSGNLFYTSNKNGWLALTSTSGLTS